MKINFESKPVYGNKDKYIKTIYIYIHIWWQYDYKFSWQKYAKRKSTMQMFINNNAGFCY